MYFDQSIPCPTCVLPLTRTDLIETLATIIFTLIYSIEQCTVPCTAYSAFPSRYSLKSLLSAVLIVSDPSADFVIDIHVGEDEKKNDKRPVSLEQNCSNIIPPAHVSLSECIYNCETKLCLHSSKLAARRDFFYSACMTLIEAFSTTVALIASKSM